MLMYITLLSRQEMMIPDDAEEKELSEMDPEEESRKRAQDYRGAEYEDDMYSRQGGRVQCTSQWNKSKQPHLI